MHLHALKRMEIFLIRYSEKELTWARCSKPLGNEMRRTTYHNMQIANCIRQRSLYDFVKSKKSLSYWERLSFIKFPCLPFYHKFLSRAFCIISYCYKIDSVTKRFNIYPNSTTIVR